MIAISKRISSSYEPWFQTSCELVWAKVNINHYQNVYIGAYYRPHLSDYNSIKQLEISLNQLINTAPYSVVWLAGDFNAPNIDWPNLRVPPGSPYNNCKQYLLDVIEDHCMMQIITEPIRDKHFLDLFFTNCPSHIMNVSTLPGLSDHDVVVIKANIKPTIHKQTKRSILLYKKADWNAIR